MPECHGAHGTQEDHLLSRSGQETCFSCHDRDEVIQQSAHAKMGASDCTSCHEPHGSNREKMLKTAFNPSKDSA